MRRTVVALALAAAACLVLLASCAGPTQSPAASQSAVGSSDIPSSDPPPTSTPSPQRTDLPGNWPDAVPAYPQGKPVIVTVSDDGTLLNATFGDSASMDESFAAMDSALHAAGYRTSQEAGGEDMLVQTEEQISQDYVGSGWDLNIVVAPGSGQTLIMVNGTKTGQ